VKIALFIPYGYRKKYEELAFAGSCYHNSAGPLENYLVLGWYSYIRNCSIFRLSAAQGQTLKNPTPRRCDL
jgi:hypothetical protein